MPGTACAAERFDEAVVAPARDDRALRAEPGRDHLEGGASVIIETSHEAWIFDVFHSAGGQQRFHLRKMGLARIAQIVGALGRMLDQRDIRFAIEQPQRIALEPIFTIVAQLVVVRPCPICRPRREIADGIGRRQSN